MKIIWSQLAVERLEDIYDYIARDNMIAATNLIESIFNKVESLLANPDRGRVSTGVQQRKRKRIIRR
ncbi:MAG: type II toxin-antitoxin system RelE/ParE family toxin [Melioribacteraceae bacterium]|nr:type II toxin-antitoxin system RelE/ParE family toxin [Melioribacteraceae bacterium]